MKNVFIVAYAFPPCGGAGVQRTAKFVKYLAEFGWQPTVLTVDPACHGVKDDSHCSDIPKGVEVIQTWHFDPVTKFTRANRSAHTSANNGNGHDDRPRRRPKVVSALRTIGRHAWVGIEKNLLIPDQALLWYPRAVAAGLAQLRKRRFDLIYATGEPYSSYFVAATLSRFSRVPFVIDMRDPWTLETYRNEVRSPLRKAAEKWQERKVLEACSAAVFANRASDLYAEAFPELAGKFHYIPNGYDSADFEDVEAKRFDRFTIVHSGTFLSGYRTADTFLKALRLLLDREPDIEKRLQVAFVGKTGDELRLVQELSLGSLVRQTGYIAHQESIAYLKGADLLLLVGGKHNWEETGKVYEYLAANRPILALVNPEGAAAELLRCYTKAQVVERTDVDRTVEALSAASSDSQRAPNSEDDRWIHQYERSRLTATLARILELCITGTGQESYARPVEGDHSTQV